MNDDQAKLYADETHFGALDQAALQEKLHQMMESVRNETRTDVARKKLEEQGAVFDASGRSFTLPGIPLTFDLTGPKGDTKLTRDQRARRAKNKAARKARRKGR